MGYLSELEFKTTFAAPMQRAGLVEEPPFDFWPYFNAIPKSDFEGYSCSAKRVEYVYRDPTGMFEHVLVDSEDRNIFMVLVLDRMTDRVVGHRLLDLPRLYGRRPVRAHPG